MKYYDECYFVNYDSYQDLRLLEVGRQKCPSEYSFGPIIRENYVLHYILSGKGSLILDNNAFSISSKQAFITPLHIPAFYKANKTNPWHYIWIHFNGEKALELLHTAGITKESPVFIPAHSENELESCILNFLKHKDSELLCTGNLYNLFHILIKLSSHRPNPIQLESDLRYVRATINFINQKFNEPLQIQDIANHCGLNRSYLSKLFKSATNYTLQEYLINYRIRKAKQYLSDPDMLVQHVAYAVGYTDPFTFSKLFKKQTGLSPTQYRNEQQKNLNGNKDAQGKPPVSLI